jgi:hypothetical protein
LGKKYEKQKKGKKRKRKKGKKDKEKREKKINKGKERRMVETRLFFPQPALVSPIS